jgi:hypothetical protein
MNEPTMTTILGGAEMEVTLIDGSKETVKVRQLPVKLMQQYAAAIADDSDAIALYCDKPKEWAETLSGASFNAVADFGLELNQDFFRAWFQRRMRIAESLKPGLSAEIQKGLNAEVAKTVATGSHLSPDSSPPSLSVVG